MSQDPSTGPMSRELFAELVKAPAGHAVKAIRAFDPQWGRKPGEKFRWKVEATDQMHGVAYVEAADEDEANKLADELNSAAFDWESGWNSDMEITSVAPDKSR